MSYQYTGLRVLLIASQKKKKSHVVQLSKLLAAT